MNPPTPSSTSSFSAGNTELHASPRHDFSSVAAAALSTSTPSHNDVANGRKRKATGVPGSRGVANLTPEQLTKKRANDREAQRAIRERTKTTIETLEKRIQELESQQPYQELQRVAQERDRALEECAQLRHKLAMVQSVIGDPQTTPQPQPNLHGMFDLLDQFLEPTWLTAGDAELATLTAQQSPLPPLNTPYSPNGTDRPVSQQQVHPDLRSPHSDTQSLAASHSSSYQARLPPPASILEPSPSNGERLDLNYVLEPKQRPTSVPSPSQGPSTYPLTSGSETPVFARLPINSPGSCPLDYLLTDFLNDCQKQANNGVPLAEVRGPEYPSFTDLLDQPPTPDLSAHPMSLLLTDVISKFPDISGLPEKVAVRYVMFLVMRWMICPCEECYERLPSWIRPLQEQLDIPHPIWNDYVPWPAIRMRLIATYPVKFQDFFVSFTARMCLNWSSRDERILVPAADGSSSVTISSAFEAHLRDLGNWSLASVFKATYPQLVDDSVRLED